MSRFVILRTFELVPTMVVGAPSELESACSVPRILSPPSVPVLVVLSAAVANVGQGGVFVPENPPAVGVAQETPYALVSTEENGARGGAGVREGFIIQPGRTVTLPPLPAGTELYASGRSGNWAATQRVWLSICAAPLSGVLDPEELARLLAKYLEPLVRR